MITAGIQWMPDLYWYVSWNLSHKCQICTRQWFSQPKIFWGEL